MAKLLNKILDHTQHLNCLKSLLFPLLALMSACAIARDRGALSQEALNHPYYG